MNKIWTVAIVCVVVAGGLGFFGGMKYQQSKIPTVATRGGAGGAGGAAGGAFGGGRRGGAAGTGFANGQVLSINGNSMTIKLMNGGSEVVVLAPSTAYRKAVDGTSADLSVGNNVTVTGTANSDGSLTAQAIQIRTSTSTPSGGMTPGSPQ